MTRTEKKSEKLTKAVGFWGLKKTFERNARLAPTGSDYPVHIII